MNANIVKQYIRVEGMTCSGCEFRIERKLKSLPGVKEVSASYASSAVRVTFDKDAVDLDSLCAAIESLDYKVDRSEGDRPGLATVPAGAPHPKGNAPEGAKAESGKLSVNQLLGIAVILLAAYLIISHTGGFNFIPQVNQNMGLGILFVVGLLTSLHCVAMCGGINLSQCVSYSFENEKSRFQKFKPSLLYNTGRVVSYTVIGGIVGAIGSAVSFSGAAKGVVAILSGVFMVIMGLNMLNIFPWLRKINPRMPKFFANKIHAGKSGHGPFIVGLLNGLMPCGPLQAMQLYALGTGSFLNGALSMMVFSLGTVPLMFGFGAASSFLSGKFTHKMMKASAVLVMVLGVVMVGRGLNLSGIGVAAASSGSGSTAQVQDGVQVVKTKFTSGKYVPIVVKKGIPVKWIITVTDADLNGCNNPVTIPKYNISKKLVAGDNEIDFTPDEEGTVPYTCWMGMISSTIKVVSGTSDGTAGADGASSSGGSPQLSAGNGGSGDSNSSSSSSSGYGAGCCAGSANATKFFGGKIPTDDIQLATVNDGVQEATVTVNDQGYSPAVVVLQKGMKAKIKFNPENLNSCNYLVDFPELNGELNLQKTAETPEIVPQQDFTFQCGMNMLHGYVKVVDDLNKVDLDQIKKEVAAYQPAQGGGCCG